MKKISFTDLAPHLLAVAIFLVITFIFFHPVIFDGKVMTQNDIVQGISSGQEIREHREATGEEALWTNSMFGGMPAYLINVQWSGDLTKHIHNFLSLYLPSPARYAFLGMLCFYILLLTFRVNPYLSIAGGIAFGLNSFNLVSIEAGHIWKVSAIMYMPLVIAGLQLLIRKKTLGGIALTAISIALMIRSNHIQIAYYLFLVLLVFGLVYLIDAIIRKTLPDFAKFIGFAVLAGALGLGANVGKIWTAAEYSPYSIRGKSELTSNTQSTSGGLDRDYAFSWSQGVTESLTFVVPYLYGGGSLENVGADSKFVDELVRAGVPRSQASQFANQAPTYWGNQPSTAGPIYAGAIVVFLFILGMFTVKGSLKYWLVTATVFGFMLAWGKNFEAFNYFMFDHFPLYNKFRAVSMALVIPLLCMPILAFVGLQKFLDSPDKKTILRAAGIGVGVAVLVWIIGLSMNLRGPNDANYQDFLARALEKQRSSMLNASAFRSIIFIALAGGLLYLYQLKKVKLSLVLGITGLLVFTDLFFVGKKYLDKDKFSKPRNITHYSADAADLEILKDASEYRVANLTRDPFADATTSYHHSSIGGYHGAKIRRYNDVIDGHLRGELNALITNLQSGVNAVPNVPVLNMLNTKYFKLGGTVNAILPNENTLGNAWFVSEIKGVANADEAIEAIGTEDLARVAISETLSSKSGLSEGSISLTSYAPNRLVYNSESSGDGYAVFSEIYYPKGWKASIDGAEADIHRANYILRALEIPSGSHEIVFWFEPRSFQLGNIIMLICGVLVFVIIGLSVWREFKTSDA